MKKYLSCVLASLVGIPLIAASYALAEKSQSEAAAVQQEPQLPPGWTKEDMEACMLAGTPGEMHKHLQEGVGLWHGKVQMWMVPGGEAMESQCVSKVSPMFDGRFIKCELEGEMPGMGPFKGFGLYGFDNVSQKLVSSWVDSQSTGLMTGHGKLSENGKVLTWEYTFNCPLTKKPTKMREVETTTGPDTKTLEMFGADPKSGQEYKMMSIALTRKPSAEASGN